MPCTLGTKIIAVGHTRDSICASWPAPEVMRRWLSPSWRATASMRCTMPPSNTTGSKRASRRDAIATPSSAASCSTNAARRASACCSIASSVWRKSTVSVARAAMTLMRFGCRSILPTVATWLPPISRARPRTKVATAAAA